MAMLKIFFVCAQVYLLKSISASCIDDAPAPRYPFPFFMRNAWRFNPYRMAPWRTAPYKASPATTYGSVGISNPAALSASKGTGFFVSSSSSITPGKISITSNNVIEGVVSVVGEIPFKGSAYLDGPVQTMGDGAVTYSCGDGEVAVIKEDGVRYEGLGTSEHNSFGCEMIC